MKQKAPAETDGWGSVGLWEGFDALKSSIGTYGTIMAGVVVFHEQESCLEVGFV